MQMLSFPNNVGDTSIGFSSDDNELTMHFKNNEKVKILRKEKISFSTSNYRNFRN